MPELVALPCCHNNVFLLQKIKYGEIDTHNVAHIDGVEAHVGHQFGEIESLISNLLLERLGF